MKTRILFAALGIALAAPFPVLAADDHQGHGSGRYEWRQVPQPGPRTTGPSLKRVRVADSAQVASCDCDMMKMRAGECMNGMRRMGEKSHG